MYFVDFGDLHEAVDPTAARFRRTMPAFGVLETPVQCLRCKLDNVLPVGGSYKGPCVYDVGKSFWFLNQFFTQNL